MSKRKLPDALEERLDELLWHVAVELDPESEHSGPPEVRAERVRADVHRFMATRAGEGSASRDRTRRMRRAASPWARAAAVVLAVGGLGAAGYWDGWIEPRARALQIESADAESWYVQVARAPDPLRSAESPDPRRCTSDSWYCVQARPASGPRDL